MFDKDFQATTEYIKNVNEKLDNSLRSQKHEKHHYKLRRCLLSCDFYHENKVKRAFCRIMMNKDCIMRAGAAIFMVTVLGVTTVWFVQGQRVDLLQTPQAMYTVESTEYSTEFLQSLYTYGYLKYSHELDDGCRVYKASINNKEVEVLDHVPYEIDMVVSH